MNWSKIKAAFFDFDDTLCIHLDHSPWLEWFRDCITGDGDIYLDKNKCAPMPCMEYLINDCKNAGIPRICLTWAQVDFVKEPKMKFIEHYYGDDAINKIYCTGTREDKVKFILEYCHEFGLKPEEVLVVEDNCSTIHEVLEAGCILMTPQEVAVRYTYKLSV